MEFEDSRNALFPEPNAYIQKCESDASHPKKVVFQEPYENLPRFYIDNDFKKGECDCIPHSKPKHDPPHNPHDGGCKDCQPQKPKPHNSPQFDIKSLLPLLGGLLGKGGGNMSNIISILGSQSKDSPSTQSSGLDFSNIMSTLASSPEMLSGVMKLFKGGGLGGLFTKKSPPKVEMKSSEINIKNYTRVD